MILGGTVPQLTKALRHNENLQLIHKECHKLKTNRERAFYKHYRQIRSKHIAPSPTPKRNSITPESTIDAFIEIYQKNKFEELKLDLGSDKRLKLIFNIAKRLKKDNIKKGSWKVA